MGELETLEAIIKLNDRLGRAVNKLEISEETGYHIQCTGRSLVKLKRWHEVELEQHIQQGKGRSFYYTVPQHVRERIEAV